MPDLEMLFRIYYNDRSAECIEVTEDPDGLGMIELRYRPDDRDYSSEMSRINLDDDQIPQLIEALTRLLEFRKFRNQ